ncbi:origin recognition complex subunit 4 [Geranomyces michiganensis]|nr:origin recognition complex subunit 4 [Geranomyces michiganensis]
MLGRSQALKAAREDVLRAAAAAASSSSSSSASTPLPSSASKYFAAVSEPDPETALREVFDLPARTLSTRGKKRPRVPVLEEDGSTSTYKRPRIGATGSSSPLSRNHPAVADVPETPSKRPVVVAKPRAGFSVRGPSSFTPTAATPAQCRATAAGFTPNTPSKSVCDENTRPPRTPSKSTARPSAAAAAHTLDIQIDVPAPSSPLYSRGLQPPASPRAQPPPDDIVIQVPAVACSTPTKRPAKSSPLPRTPTTPASKRSAHTSALSTFELLAGRPPKTPDFRTGPGTGMGSTTKTRLVTTATKPLRPPSHTGITVPSPLRSSVATTTTREGAKTATPVKSFYSSVPPPRAAPNMAGSSASSPSASAVLYRRAGGVAGTNPAAAMPMAMETTNSAKTSALNASLAKPAATPPPPPKKKARVGTPQSASAINTRDLLVGRRSPGAAAAPSARKPRVNDERSAAAAVARADVVVVHDDGGINNAALPNHEIADSANIVGRRPEGQSRNSAGAQQEDGDLCSAQPVSELVTKRPVGRPPKSTPRTSVEGGIPPSVPAESSKIASKRPVGRPRKTPVKIPTPSKGVQATTTDIDESLSPAAGPSASLTAVMESPTRNAAPPPRPPPSSLSPANTKMTSPTKPAPQPPPIPTPSSIPPQTFLAARRHITSRLTSRSALPTLIGLTDQHAKIHSLLSRTISRGESNSVLLMGNRGTGKSALVDSALQKLRAEFSNEAFITVRLSGLFQTDDRLALREIMRCLSSAAAARRRDGSDDTTTAGDGGDNTVDDADLDAAAASGRWSFAQCLSYVLDTLRAGNARSSTPVVFVLDDVDLFAMHPKQALLYNLFDACQTAQNPIAVVAMTTRIDFVDLLEKRVKSRFSHRQVCIYPAENFAAFLDIMRAAVRIAPDDNITTTTTEDKNNVGGCSDESVSTTYQAPAAAPEADAFRAAFNWHVDEMLRSGMVVNALKRVYDLGKDVRAGFRILYTLIIRLSQTDPYPTPPLAARYLPNPLAPDPKVTTIASLSILELMLLIAMQQHEARQVDAYNFEMVYDEYREFIQAVGSLGRGATNLFYVKGVAMKAFERLGSLELWRPEGGVGSGGGGGGVGNRGPKEYRMVRMAVGRREVELGVRAFKDAPKQVLKWAIG